MLCAREVQARKGRANIGRMRVSIQHSTFQLLPWEVTIITTRPILTELTVQGRSMEREGRWVSVMDLPRDWRHPVHGQQLEMVGLHWVGWTMKAMLGMTRAGAGGYLAELFLLH